MAYFPNGSSGDYYQDKYCFRCLNYIDKGDDRGIGCPIWDAHIITSYDQCKNKGVKEILEILWPTNKDGFPAECSMYQNNGECEGQMFFKSCS